MDGEKSVHAHQDLIIPVLIQCRTRESCKSKRNLGLKLHDVINSND